jgi:Xaa-Pro dipeptidase
MRRGRNRRIQLKDMLESQGRAASGSASDNSYGLTHFNGKAVDAALAGFCKLAEASDLVNRIRVVCRRPS